MCPSPQPAELSDMGIMSRATEAADQCGFAGVKSAFKSKDAKASKAAHRLWKGTRSYPERHAERHGRTESEHFKAVVFGGLDGIITTLAVVASCVGASLEARALMAIAVGNLVADAFSMGVGEYISSKAESEYKRSEYERESWEMQNCPEEEQMEMADLYVERYGFSREDADSFVKTGFKYPNFFLQHMMVEELGMMVDFGEPPPWKRGMAMFISFFVLGAAPLIALLIWWGACGTEHTYLSVVFSCLMSSVALFVLGWYKGKITEQNRTLAGLWMVGTGVIAGGLSLGIGFFGAA